VAADANGFPILGAVVTWVSDAINVATVVHGIVAAVDTGTATIDFSTGQSGRVSISVYDVTGRRVATLLDVGNRAAGPGSVTFDARAMPSGVYFVKMQTSLQTLSKKITIVK